MGIEAYLTRAYGPFALKYVAILYSHDVYSEIYARRLKLFSILSKHQSPCYMRHEKASPLDYDREEYQRIMDEYQKRKKQYQEEQAKDQSGVAFQISVAMSAA
jgi:hypothetical protein